MPRVYKLILFLSFLNLVSCTGNSGKESGNAMDVSSHKKPTTSPTIKLVLGIKDDKIKHLDLNFIMHDLLFFGTPFKLSDTLSIDLMSNNSFLILSDKNQIPIKVSAGDSIYFTASEVTGSIVVRSSNKQNNEFIQFIHEVTRKYGALFPFILDLPSQQRKVNVASNIILVEKEINKLKQDRLEFLKVYNENYSMSDIVFEELQRFIELATINDYIILYQNNRRLLEASNLLTSKLIDVSSNAKKIGFQGSFPYYFVYSNLVDLAANIPDFLDSKAKFDNSIAYINKHVDAETKDFLLSRYTYRAIMNDIISLDQSSKYVEQGMPYSNFLKKKVIMLANKQQLLANDNYFNIKSNKSLLLKNILDAHKGKVILVDFWASWCQPCIAEFPNSNKLLEKFSDKEFSILYFSIDQDLDNWKHAVEKYKLNKGNSYLVGENNKFIKELQLKSIPRYVLIDKHGGISDANAPRPGSKEILSKISSLLKN